jgi:hypothetical protein
MLENVIVFVNLHFQCMNIEGDKLNLFYFCMCSVFNNGYVL